MRGSRDLPLSVTTRTLNLDVRGLDDVGPLIRVMRDALTELRRRSRNDALTHVDQPGPQLRVNEPCIDFRVELFDYVGRRILRRDNAKPLTRFVPRYDFTGRRNS